MVALTMGDVHVARWMRHAVEFFYERNTHETSGGVHHARFVHFMQNVSPPPAALCAIWEQRVWKLQDEPDVLHFLRCLASVCCSRPGGDDVSFLLDVRSFLSLPPVPPVESDTGGDSGLQRHIVRIVALRLLPSTTDVIQLGWDVAAEGSGAITDPSSPLRPAYCSRTHVVVQFASRRHFSAWAYGDVGLRLRVGAVVCALMYPSRTEDQELAFVFHNVADPTAADYSVGPPSLLPHRTPGDNITAPPFSLPCRLSFGELVGSFAPEIAGQTLCKSLLLLVVVHTMYRAVRCRTRQPLHLLLLGASRSGKSALLRVFLRLLGPHATLVGSHIVHGQQRSVAMSQAIAATYPHVSQQLLLGGAVSTFDALVVDEISNRCCADLVEGLMTGVCPINGSVSAATLRGHATVTRVQVTAAANDDLFAASALMQQFSVVARTTAQLSLRNAAAIGEGVIAVSVARSQMSSRTPSRSVSLSEPSSRWSDATSCAGPLTEALLLAVVQEAPSPSTLETIIPAEAFARFYGARLSEYLSGGNHSSLSLASMLSVLWELNVSRLILERWCRCGDGAAAWSEALAEEVWRCYEHHLQSAHAAQRAGGRGGDFPPGGGAARRGGRRAVCVALLRLMARRQRESGGVEVPEDTARGLFQQLGGEAITGQSFHAVIQQLLDAAFIIRRLNAYAVIGEA